VCMKFNLNVSQCLWELSFKNILFIVKVYDLEFII